MANTNGSFSNLVGSVLTAVNAALDTKDNLVEHTKSFGNKARILGEKIYEDIANFNDPKPNTKSKNFLAGAIVGLLLGAGSAAVLTPKTGKQLRKKLSEKYKDASEKTHEIIDYLNKQASKTERKVKAEKRAVKRKVASVKRKVNAASRSANKTAKAVTRAVKSTARKATRTVKKAARKTSRAL